MTSRGVRGAAIGLLLMAGPLVAGRQMEAHAIGGLNTVAVSPAHGKTAAAFQATYAISPCSGTASVDITFSWGALPTAGQVLGTVPTDSACRATLTAAPPVSPVTHQ